MLKNILALFAGIIVAMIAMMAIQMLSALVYPAPIGLGMQDKAALARWAESLPIGAYLIVLLGYTVGSFLGGWTIGKLAKSRRINLALTLGVALTIAGFLNLKSIPHPIWFAVASTIVYIPMAYLGARIGRGTTEED